MEIALPLLIVLACIFFEGFFSGSEIALVSADKTKLHHLSKKGSKAASLILRLFRRPEWLLATTLTGTNIAIVTGSTVATATILKISPEYGDLFAILVLTPFTLFWGEIVSKGVFQQKADALATRLVYPLFFFLILLLPIVVVFTTIAGLLSRVFGVSANHHGIFVNKDELKMIVDMTGETNEARQQEKHIIQRLLDFSEITARESMKPMVDIVAVSSDDTVSEAIESLKQTDFSWVLIYTNRSDLITGYIDYFDLLNMDKNDRVQSVVRTAYYVPPHKPINKLLVEMQERHISFAVVVDEYGGAQGIVTMEDILEEVVGDIVSEHEKRQPLFRKIAENQIIVKGRTEVEQINEIRPLPDLEIPEDGNYVTLAGFLIYRMCHIPQVGETYELENYLMTVEKADGRTVLEVRITGKELEASAQG